MVFRELRELRRANASQIVSPAEKIKIVDELTKSLSTDVVSLLENNWRDKLISNENRESTLILASSMIKRLMDEVFSLNTRGNVNLSLGTTISILGIGLLAYFVYISTSEIMAGDNLHESALKFGIRLSLAIFVQVFAFFFLKLYRYSLFETKYFQNEITNAEFRTIAIVMAFESKDPKLLAATTQNLAATERNFILKKGDTTIGLRREQMELDYEATVLTSAERLVSSLRNAKKPPPSRTRAKKTSAADA